MIQDSSLNGKRKRLKLALKRLRNLKDRENNVEKLRNRIQQFRTLTERERCILPRKQESKSVYAIKAHAKIREYAASIYSALLRGWNCTCPYHHANLRLDHGGASLQDETSQLPFHFAFSFTCLKDGNLLTEWSDVEVQPMPFHGEFEVFISMKSIVTIVIAQSSSAPNSCFGLGVISFIFETKSTQ